MAQSLSKLYVHLIFSTKNRARTLPDEVRHDLHSYMGGTLGAFSVSQSQVEDVRAYIRNQREHHRVKLFQEEFRAFLKAYEVEFDERYVWD